MAAGAAKCIMEGAGSIGKLGGEALGKIVNSFTGKAGSEAAEQTAKATSKGAAEATQKGVADVLKEGVKNQVKKHPGVAIGAVAIPAAGIATGHGEAVLSAPFQAAGTAVNVIDGGFTAAEGLAGAASDGVSAAAGGLGGFIKNNASWLLPVAGVAGAGMLLSKGGLGGVAKMGLLAGGAMMAFNALSGVSQPANNSISQSMQNVAETEGSAIERATDAMFGKSEPAREKVDTSQLPVDANQQSTYQMGY